MNVPIRELVQSAVIQAGEADTVGEVREKMTSHHIGALPVVSAAGDLLGIVTADDLVADYPATLPVTRIMTHPVDTIGVEAGAVEAARRMLEHRHHHLVVMKDDQIVGILSSFDLLRAIDEPATV